MCVLKKGDMFMVIKEIDGLTFNNFANNHYLKNFFQTNEYGELMKNSDFSVMFVGGYENNEICAGSLILYKTMGPNIKFGYAPRGFIIDYYNIDLLTEFTKKIKAYFFNKGFAFIKINPEITYAILNFNEKSKSINARNKDLIDTLKSLGYVKLKDNLYFESVLPKYTPVISLRNYDLNNINNDTKNNIFLCERKGIRLALGDEKDLETFYEFVKHKKNKTFAYYKHFYNKYKNSDMVDLVMVEINYELYAKFLQKEFIYHSSLNDEANKIFENNPQDIVAYNNKMESDRVIEDIKADIFNVNKRMQENVTKEYIGGAFVVRHEGRVTIIITGHYNNYSDIDVKEFLFYKMIEMYQNANYKFIDLYGITADYTDKNPYKSLNEFKLRFNPVVYEYIGEFDLIVNKAFHQLLWSTNKIQKEFYKPTIKKN